MRRRMLAALVLALAGCKEPAAESDGPFEPGGATLLSVGSPLKDEDPSVLLARDGRVYVAWFSERAGNPGDIYVTSTADGEQWSDAVRVTTHAGGDFNPSLIQDDQGTFHLAWFHWTAPFLGNIWYSSSTDGRAWAPETQATKAFNVDDWVPTIARAADGTLLVYFVSLKRSANGTNDLYLAARRPGAADWDAVVPVTALSSATEHDHLPFAARTPEGITLVWDRYDTSDAVPWTNPKSDLYYAVSPNGLTGWSAPRKITTDAGRVVNLFPALYESFDRGWALAWLSTRSGDPKVFDLSMSDRDRYPTGVARDDAFPNAYSPKISKTPKEGVYIAVWVQGAEGSQDVYYRLFRR